MVASFMPSPEGVIGINTEREDSADTTMLAKKGTSKFKILKIK